MKTLLLITFVFLGILLQAQNDIVYPTEGAPIIFDCKIDAVIHGNVVYYTKLGESNTTEAIRIVRNGITLELEVGKATPTLKEPIYQESNSYKYYEDKYRRAKGGVGGGAFMTFFGLGLNIGGVILASDEPDIAAAMLIGGTIFFNIGLPVWISSAVKKKNNWNAMQRERNTKVQLHFGTTSNGIGLRVSL